METSLDHSADLIPGLPDELGFDCLSRLPYPTHRVASRVCRRWQSLIQSPEFYNLRRLEGHTHKLVCLVQALPRTDAKADYPNQEDNPLKRGDKTSMSFGISVYDSTDSSWHRLDPVPKYQDGLPLFCGVASCDGKLVVLGGWDPRTYEPVTDVFIFDFSDNKWRQGRSMPTKRSFFAFGAHSGRIYIAGGHDENKNALSSAWVYDLELDEWTEMTRMTRDRDECEGMVMGGAFWVVSGYATENQGAFDASADVYDFESGMWRLVEGAWKEGKCPRGCVALWREEERRLASWSGLQSAIRVETCGVVLGDRVMVVGSGYQDGNHGFYMIELTEGQIGKFETMSVPAEFRESVQSGCCLEI